MFTSEVQIRVPYADTDQMGYVYYGNYAKYYEMGRTEALRTLGVSYKKLEETGVMMPVLENHSKYLAPALYDELLTIKVLVKDFPTAKMVFQYEIYNEEKKLIHTGETLMVFMRKDTRRMCRVPEEVIATMKPYFSNQVSEQEKK